MPSRRRSKRKSTKKLVNAVLKALGYKKSHRRVRRSRKSSRRSRRRRGSKLHAVSGKRGGRYKCRKSLKAKGRKKLSKAARIAKLQLALGNIKAARKWSKKARCKSSRRRKSKRSTRRRR